MEDTPDFRRDLEDLLGQAPDLNSYVHPCPLCGVLGPFAGPCVECQRMLSKAIAAWHAPITDKQGHYITYAQAQEWPRYKQRGFYREECVAILAALNFN